jgi:hypothetical protein
VPSTVPIRRALKRLPGSANELLDATGGFDPLEFHPAAYVDANWANLPNRVGNVLRIESAAEQDRKISANLCGKPPVGTRSSSASASFRVAVNEDS